jgi:ABC-type lipoprotein release transport system permease subunit
MTALRYVLRSVVHYRAAYLGVLAGAVLGATVLLGALFAGDSVAASLRRIAEQRIGRATHVVASGDRFFRQALADDLATAARVHAAPVLLARGTATHASSRASANEVQLVGVTPAFWSFAPDPATRPPSLVAAKSEIAVNDTLARRLRLSVGDTVVVRLSKPGVLAGNAPIAGAEASAAMRRSLDFRYRLLPHTDSLAQFAAQDLFSLAHLALQAQGHGQGLAHLAGGRRLGRSPSQ